MIRLRRMNRAQWVIRVILCTLVLLGALAWRREPTAAQSNTPRNTTIVVTYTENEWWLIRWSDNTIVCRILTDHEGLPTVNEVVSACGQDLGEQWWSTPPCDVANQDPSTCPGFYLHLVSFRQAEREVQVQLPPPVVWVDLEGCTPTPPENRCPNLPTLLLTGEEPLPNERITAIHGVYNDQPFTCDGNTCRLPLGPTPPGGITIQFWADSSYGDTTENYTAQVRVLDAGVPLVPGGGGWYVDVISSQWRGAPIASCARIWEAFPPAGYPPAWLSTPDQFELMATDAPYYYLAGRLIASDQVDVNECVTGGLLPNGYADACGLEKARPLVAEWQNQFDQRIIQVARETGVPAQLIKNLFAQESQFWPNVFRVQHEFGLGQITSNGADSILLWNRSFFDQFCPMVLAEDACQGGYLSLNETYKEILRGALALQAKTDCPNCPAGINLVDAEFSVGLFANTLVANCAQVNQTVYTATQQVAGSLSSYEDLWRFTVANYHAGPGCVAYAIHTAWDNTGVLNWDEVSRQFTPACQGAVPYVEKITR